MKYNATTLEKIEKLMHETEYVVRYERGNFQSGYCILEDKKILVLNKFLPVEGRISTLMDIIPQLSFRPEILSAESRKIYDHLMKVEM